MAGNEEEKMSYIDGYVVPVAIANREIYKTYAEKAAAIFKEHGATRVVECWGNDVPDGKTTSFPMAVKLKAEEAVVFSFVEWPSKELRDAGLAKVMNDPRFDMKSNPMPFDGQRMIYGGFEAILDI